MTKYIKAVRNPVLTSTTALVLALFTAGLASALDNNLQISGTLVTEPCSLDVNNNTLTVDFGTIIEKGLYKDVRTPGFPLTITLTECDISLGKLVNLTFTGAESAALPGYLATTGAGSTGVAIGIETPDGVNLPLNKATPGYALQDGTTQIALQAYVEAEPEAIKNQSLVPGEFSATATIDAEYP
ncbi:fimbrial protein [Enterobacter cancerogenus]|uniref:fimbrial protein n=1 Tax=Enterobacter cancerogenus TaxID=69218 RepID=UPI0030764A84